MGGIIGKWSKNPGIFPNARKILPQPPASVAPLRPVSAERACAPRGSWDAAPCLSHPENGCNAAIFLESHCFWRFLVLDWFEGDLTSKQVPHKPIAVCTTQGRPHRKWGCLMVLNCLTLFNHPNVLGVPVLFPSRGKVRNCPLEVGDVKR